MLIIQSIEYEWEKSERGSQFASRRSLLPEELPLDCIPNNHNRIVFDNKGRFLNQSEDLVSCDRFNIKYNNNTSLVEIEILGIQSSYGIPPTIVVNRDEWIRLKYNYRRVDGNHSIWFFGIRIVNVGNFCEFEGNVFLKEKAKRIYDFQKNLYRISK